MKRNSAGPIVPVLSKAVLIDAYTEKAESQCANDGRVFSSFVVTVTAETDPSVPSINPPYAATSRFRLNKIASSGGVSLYRFETSNSKSIMVVKTDFSIQFHCAVRFWGMLPFRFTVGNTG